MSPEIRYRVPTAHITLVSRARPGLACQTNITQGHSRISDPLENIMVNAKSVRTWSSPSLTYLNLKRVTNLCVHIINCLHKMLRR